MPDLSFKIEGAAAIPFAAIPTLGFQLRVTNAIAGEAIHTVALRCQIQIEVARRRYTPQEQGSMRDLFGEPERWSRTLRTMLWTHAGMIIPGFEGTTLVDLPVPCSSDFNVAATKYFEGLVEGEIPLEMLFSGTVFYADPGGTLQVSPISWQQEAKFRLPVKAWREMMDSYYPNSVWINLRRDVFQRLYRYKSERGIPTWEQALESMLSLEETVRS